MHGYFIEALYIYFTAKVILHFVANESLVKSRVDGFKNYMLEFILKNQ